MAFCDNCGHELRSTSKFCGACGTKAETASQDTNQHSVDETPPPKHGYQRAPGNDMGITTSRPAGRIWYLLPLLFGIFGGIIAYAVIRNRNPRRARNIMILAVVLLIPHILLGIIFDDDFEIGSQLSEEEIMEQCHLNGWPGWNELLRNNEDYVGEIISVQGRTNYVGSNWFHVDKGGDSTHRVRVNYDASTTLVVYEDHVSVCGTVIGLDTYTSLTGKITAPEVKALIINGVLQP